jgi:hypothetical protein
VAIALKTSVNQRKTRLLLFVSESIASIDTFTFIQVEQIIMPAFTTAPDFLVRVSRREGTMSSH